MYLNFIKRIFDILCSIIILIIFSPIFICVAIVCFFSFNGIIFFTQQRVGKNEKVFYILKFITMKPEVLHTASPVNDNDRLTPFGIFLRKSSLDELPQLINVVKGDMSLVGPRPLLVKYLPYYRVDEKIRHTVRPGITGLAQIKGRNNLSWNDRLAFDCTYVNNISLGMDIRILMETLGLMFSSKHVNPDPRSSMLDLDEERKNEHLPIK